MSASKKILDLCVPEAAGDCVCHGAVQRGYAELTACGLPPKFAQQAAVAIYRWHHPEASLSQARDTVDYWLRTPAH